MLFSLFLTLYTASKFYSFQNILSLLILRLQYYFSSNHPRGTEVQKILEPIFTHFK